MIQASSGRWRASATRASREKAPANRAARAIAHIPREPDRALDFRERSRLTFNGVTCLEGQAQPGAPWRWRRRAESPEARRCAVCSVDVSPEWLANQAFSRRISSASRSASRNRFSAPRGLGIGSGQGQRQPGSSDRGISRSLLIAMPEPPLRFGELVAANRQVGKAEPDAIIIGRRLLGTGQRLAGAIGSERVGSLPR